jgi:redox-sensing transcriptional repressor
MDKKKNNISMAVIKRLPKYHRYLQGYNVRDLSNEIRSILGLTKDYKTVIIGAGNIGQAIANYTRFDRLGFALSGIFDANPKLIGLRIRDVEIQDIDDLPQFLENTKIDVGIICVPKNSAQRVCDGLVQNGVKAIWNFAPTDLVVPNDIVVENVHLSESLLTLSYLLKDKDEL